MSVRWRHVRCVRGRRASGCSAGEEGAGSPEDESARRPRLRFAMRPEA